MRERKWTVWGMTGTLVLFGAASVFGQAPAVGDSKPAASVNGEIITMTDLETAIKQIGPMAVTLPENLRKQQQQEILNGLILEKLQRQFLKQQPPIDPEELKKRLGELEYQLERQNKTLADFCRERNQTPAQLRDSLAAALQWRAYADAHISDQQVEKYYQENKDLFDKVTVHLAEIMLHVPAQAGAEERQRVKARLTQLRDDIASKKIDFAQAAKQYSQGPTKEQGGDLGWWLHLKGSLSAVPPLLMDTAFTLQPAQISDVLETEVGFHLLTVLERKPGEPSDFNKVKEEARQLCIEEMQQSFLQEQRQKAKIEIYLPH